MGSPAGNTAKKYQEEYDRLNPNRDAFNTGSLQALNSYQQAVAGNAPSFAQELLRQQTDNNIAQMASLAASQRGRDPAAAGRQQMMQTAQLNQQAAQQGAMLRAQEMEAARAGLAGFAGGQLGRMDQGRNQAGALGMEIGKADDWWSKGVQGISALGQGLQGAGKMFGTSDERAKTEITDGKKDVRKFLDHIAAKSYRYKEEHKNTPYGGKGRYVSPMAQDLEKSELGKDMVIDTPQGKLVNYAKGFGAMLAAQADIHDRLKKVEGKK